MQWKLLMSLILSVFVALFALQNSDPVTVSFLVLKMQISQALIIILSAALGAILSLFLGLIKQISSSNTIKEKDKKIRILETEISALKTENESLKLKEDKADASINKIILKQEYDERRE